MLSFKHEQGRFSCRTVGVVIDGGRLLIHRAEEDDFWALPGGRVEFGESAREALARELSEELEVEAEVGRLIWVMENFFTYAGERHHEVSFYFHVTLPPDSDLPSRKEPFLGDEQGTRLIFEWRPVDGLEDAALYPSFLRRAVAALPAETQYVVHQDEGDEPKSF